MLRQPRDPAASSHLPPTLCPFSGAHRCAGDREQRAPALSPPPQQHEGESSGRVEFLGAAGPRLFSEESI